MRYRFKLTCFKSSEKNRLQNCLTVSNIQLGNVVSDTFGKSAQAILDKLLENPADTSFDLEPLVYKSLKKKLPELRDAIDGFITPEQAGKLKVIKGHFEDLESRKAELEELILALAAPISRNLPFSKPLLVSAVFSLPSESFPRSVPTWRLFLRRNTCAHGLVLHRPTMKVPQKRRFLLSTWENRNAAFSCPLLRSRGRKSLATSGFAGAYLARQGIYTLSPKPRFYCVTNPQQKEP